VFSVLILTLNEEANLPACLASVAGCDDVVVLDSGSTDATCRIAREHGARVHTRRFDDFSGQRNHADTQIVFRHPLVFHLDADERMTPGLFAECSALGACPPPDIDGWYAAPRMLWRGRWLRRCTDFPAWQARLVRVPGFRFIQAGHGQREAEGMRMARLSGNYLHEMGGYDIEAWLAKHRRYAAQEATQAVARPLEPGSLHRALLAGSRLERRRALKQVAAALPCRPALRFVYQYLLRAGFLDGRGSLEYCRLLSRYEGFIRDELRRQARLAGEPKS